MDAVTENGSLGANSGPLHSRGKQTLGPRSSCPFLLPVMPRKALVKSSAGVNTDYIHAREAGSCSSRSDYTGAFSYLKAAPVATTRHIYEMFQSHKCALQLGEIQSKLKIWSSSPGDYYLGGGFTCITTLTRNKDEGPQIALTRGSLVWMSQHHSHLTGT